MLKRIRSEFHYLKKIGAEFQYKEGQGQNSNIYKNRGRIPM